MLCFANLQPQTLNQMKEKLQSDTVFSCCILYASFLAFLLKWTSYLLACSVIIIINNHYYITVFVDIGKYCLNIYTFQNKSLSSAASDMLWDESCLFMHRYIYVLVSEMFVLIPMSFLSWLEDGLKLAGMDAAHLEINFAPTPTENTEFAF